MKIEHTETVKRTFESEEKYLNWRGEENYIPPSNNQVADDESTTTDTDGFIWKTFRVASEKGLNWYPVDNWGENWVIKVHDAQKIDLSVFIFNIDGFELNPSNTMVRARVGRSILKDDGGEVHKNMSAPKFEDDGFAYGWVRFDELSVRDE